MTSVVGIGASAGGIEAFRDFFVNMPVESGLAFVVVLHLPADRKSLLPEILRRWTKMEIIEVVESCRLEPNRVYVPPPGLVVTLKNGMLRSQGAIPDEPREPRPIDIFFDSLAAELREDAVGIVLSGTGSDGALGLKAIKSCGGLTLAQGTDGTAPQHDGMPSSAISTGAVDIIASAEAMPAKILAVQQARVVDHGSEDQTPEKTDAARHAICDILLRQRGHDFSGYKERTFIRRVQRRMQVLSVPSLTDYTARLDRDPTEGLLLFSDLLIGVTRFFRDSETFAALERIVMPLLFAAKGSDATIRAWVPGCSTGEEAYSIAILLREYADSLGRAAPRLQVFATDLDAPAIETARAGRYPSTLLDDVPHHRLSRFFVSGNDGSYTVAKEVREICTFSVHSLTRDPPFSRMSLVSCRNLLIYLDADLQAAVIPAFHYSLAPGGYLLLGSSETIARHEDLFVPLEKAQRIFQRRDVPSPQLRLPGRSTRDVPQVSGKPAAKPEQNQTGAGKSDNRASNRVLEHFAPPFLVVTGDGEIVQFSSRTGRFLEPPPGPPSQNAILMARPEIRVQLRAVLKQAVGSGRVSERRAVFSEAQADSVRIKIVVEPIAGQRPEQLYLIVFNELDQSGTEEEIDAESEATGPPDRAFDERLEAELRDTREQLLSITEEHAAALEELRSANEELHSVNEELQSTNEELETSKEEIQSINEELQTVNSQLASKVDELDQSNADLKNLLDSTQVATVFLDPYLIVRGFTPAVASLYNLIPSDVGRPLTDIVGRLRYSDLREDARRVLSTLEPLERRVSTESNDAHYLMRILPYRTPDSRIDGTLVTFVDVTSIVRAEQHQRLLVDELNHRVKNMLTVVISLATQTIRRSKSMEEFSINYMGRIQALTAAYSLLSSESWQTVRLRDIIAQELAPFLTSDNANVVIEGPQVMLPPRAALALGMAVHELTTNAVKYGALSVSTGRIHIEWDIRREPQNDRLVLVWSESGGPEVVAPSNRGFGMTMIERGLKQDMTADVEIRFDPTGLVATVSAPIEGASADDALTAAGN